MKKLAKYIFLIFLLLLFFIPLSSFAGGKNKLEIRVRLAINDELKQCRPYLYEAVGGFYKQRPGQEWKLIKFESENSEFFNEYCQVLGYSYSDEILLPSRWVRTDWKFYYAILSIIVATGVLIIPFVKLKKKK